MKFNYLKTFYFLLGIFFFFIFLAFALFSIPFASAGWFGYDKGRADVNILNYYINNTNSSEYWDNLDTPADISGSQIQNDLGWITAGEGEPSWNANFTNMKVDCPAGNYTYGILGNGTLKCRDDLSGAGAETDPIFIAENVSLWDAINLRLLISDQKYNETTWVLSQNYLTSIPDNSTKLYCGNITGAVSDLCTIISGGNLSFNQSLTDTLYIFQSNEAKLNVNSSDYWDNLNSINTTQMQDNGGVLNILESWLTSFFDALFGAKTTDDLTEGTTNYYDNRSWNQSLADTLYGFSNSSFNQSLTDLLYAGIEWDYNQTYSGSTYNETYNTWAYNQTIPAIEYVDNINTSLSSRIDSISGGNGSFNQSLTDTLYAGIDWGYNQTTPANAYTDAVNASQTNWITATFLSISNAISQYFNKTDIQEQYYNKTDIDVFGFVNSTGLDAYNETDWVLAQNYLTSYDETDPVFIAENTTLWNAINNRLTLTDQRFNETTLILSINTTSNIMSLGFYNKLEIDDLIAGVGNLSFNQSLTDMLYASIVWGHNQTQPAIDYVDAQGFITEGIENNTAGWIINFTKIFSNDWSNVTITESQISDLGNYLTEETDPVWTANSSAVLGCINNVSYLRTDNATYSNLLNQNCPAGKVVNGTLTNGTFICVTPTAVETDPAWQGNYTIFTGLIDNSSYLSTYNSTYDATTKQWDANYSILAGSVNNASYLSTSNDTYSNILNQQCPDGNYTYQIQANGTILCRDDVSGAGIETDPVWTANFSLGYYINHTLAVFNTYGQWFYNQTVSAITDINNRFWNKTQSYNRTEIDSFNASWSSTYNDTYAGCVNNVSYLSTYNATYAASVANNTFNQSLTDLLYANIKWDYNMTTATYNLYNAVWISTYNSSYATWLGNYSIFTGLINNASYLSTYNDTYAGYNETTWALSKFIPFNGTTTNLTVNNLKSTNTQINVLTNINMTSKNVTSVDCIIFKSGGQICST